MTFTRKGGKRQTAPPNAAAPAVLRSLADGATPEDFLFHNRRGHNLSATEAEFQRAVRAAGIDDFHFHDLRHTFATRLRLRADAFTVRDLLGHAKVDTSDISVTSAFEEQRRAVARCVATCGSFTMLSPAGGERPDKLAFVPLLTVLVKLSNDKVLAFSKVTEVSSARHSHTPWARTGPEFTSQTVV